MGNRVLKRNGQKSQTSQQFDFTYSGFFRHVHPPFEIKSIFGYR
jgi:hypothetical protein